MRETDANNTSGELGLSAISMMFVKILLAVCMLMGMVA